MRALLLGIIVQAASNTGNTYWDFVNGADVATVNNGADADKVLKHKGVLVDGQTSPQAVLMLTTMLYAASAAIMTDRLIADPSILLAYLAGILLSHFYTADPIRLKYYALGDLAIFISFGPLLTFCTTLLISPSAGEKSGFIAQVWVLTVPCQMICECILHANNSRDIGEDFKNGLTTVATLLGFDRSKYLFISLIAGAYLVVAVTAIRQGSLGMLLVFLSVPIATDVVSRFSRDANRMADLPKQVAKLHMVFGILMIVGVLTS